MTLTRTEMASSQVVIARFYEHIEPIDRGERYEDPLQEILEKSGVGRVTGGGSQLDEHGAIAFAEVELELTNLNDALRIVAEALEALGAPQGSELISENGVLREFGRQQCVAVYLDGTGLPDEVYAELDFNAVLEALGNAAGEDSFRSTSQGDQETGLYFFGADAETMFARMEPVLRRLPIGQNARVVVRHGKQSLEPREVRLPMHD